MIGGDYIGLEGVANARDLGGYVMQDGRTVRKGLLLRSGNLMRATPEDKRRLQEEFHLRRIFDFRTYGEVYRAPDCVIPGSSNTLLPTIDPEIEKRSGEAMPAEVFLNLEAFLLTSACDPRMQRLARNMYPDFAYSEYTQLQYAAFLNGVLGTKEGAVLWHCSQGKDRTGLGAAFLLSCLGASREVIIADFDRSNDFYRDTVARLSAQAHAQGWGAEEDDVIQAFIGVHTGNFIRTLDSIDRDFGSLHDYIVNQLLFSDAEQAQLRERYLE